MPVNGFFSRRALLVIAVLCLTLWTQSAAMGALYEHKHPADANCSLCQFGVSPFLQTAMIVPAGPTEFIEWLTPLKAGVAYHPMPHAPSSPRAPPV